MTSGKPPKRLLSLTDEEWIDFFENLQALGVSKTLTTRDINYLKEYTNAPVESIETYLILLKDTTTN